MKLYLVRHGLTEWNAAKRLQGHRDIELTDTGRDQARALRTVIETLSHSASVVSDLKRARETADLIGAANYALDPALRERDAGVWTGRTIAEISGLNQNHWRGWNDGSYAPAEAESWPCFTGRVCHSINSHLATADGDLLVVCHGGTIRACATEFLGLGPHNAAPVAHASLTVLDINDRPGSARLEVYNHRPGPLNLITPE